MHRSESGQAALEFVIIAPMLLLLLAGIVEFGIILNQTLVVTAAAREGVRAAAVGGNDAAVTAASKAVAKSIDGGSLAVVVSPAVRTSGQSVSVIVTNPVPISIPMISKILGTSNYTVKGEANMRME